MAPSLLAGFAVAGVLSLLVTPRMVYDHLGRSSFWQICKASIFGVPLPLCSCSVLPVAASLRKYGAGRGSTISFLTSTPQTGVDSIFVTWRMLGPVFAVIRCVAAFVSGVICGCCVQIFVGKDDSESAGPERDGCGCGCSRSEAENTGKPSRWLQAARYAFVTLPRDMGRSMIIGLIISGVLTAFLPENYFADKLIGNELVSMLVMLVVGLTVYVCSSGSVPVVLSLIAAGLSPGAGLVFLVTGPATNAAAIATVVKILGARVTAVYLATLSLTALAAGYILNRFVDSAGVAGAVHGSHEGISRFSHLCAVVLVMLLLPAFRPKRSTSEPTSRKSI